MFQDKEIWPQTAGIDGGDFCGKTRYALCLIKMMRAYGLDSLYVHLPVEAGISWGLIQNFDRLDVPRECRSLVYAANRTEALWPLRQWQSESDRRWLVFDRTDLSGVAYSSDGPGYKEDYLRALDDQFPEPEIGFFLYRSAQRSRELMDLSGQRTGTSSLQDTLDRNFELQQRVRENFGRYIEGRSNWKTINIDHPEEPILEGEHPTSIGSTVRLSLREWETYISARIWAIFCLKTRNGNYLPQTVKTEVLTGFTEGTLMGRDRAEQLLDLVGRYGVVGEEKERMERQETQRTLRVIRDNFGNYGPERR